MNNVLKFSVSDIDLIDNVNKTLFRKLKVRAFATGENVHTLPITEDVLKRGAKTIYDKPIIWKYNKWIDDAEGHEIDEVPVGFIKESESNPIIFEKSEDGRIFLTIEALIWARYCGRLIEIFERDKNFKDVSVEILTQDKEQPFCDKPLVENFCIAGITILGEMINPAVKGCGATLLSFSEDKKKYLEDLEKFSEGIIKINNEKDDAVSGTWENPRRKLFNPISRASNSKSLLKEAYLIGDFDTQDYEISKFKYPHHIVKNNMLVLHIDGVKAAFQRASQQGIVNGQIKAHLLRHYKELGLSMENFEEFGLSKEDFETYFKEEICNNESGCIKNMSEKTIKKMGIDEENVDVTTGENTDEATKTAEDANTTEAVGMAEETPAKDENSKEGENEENMSVENKPENTEEGSENMSDEGEEPEDDKEPENTEEPEDEGEKKISVEEFECKMQEMSEKLSELEKQNGVYMSQIEAMSDYEDLKKFKFETEERMAKEKEMEEMNKVMSEISEKGFAISDESKKEMFDKIKEFSSIEAWSNYVKAKAFDMSSIEDGVNKIGLPFATPVDTGSIWDKI